MIFFERKTAVKKQIYAVGKQKMI